MFPAHRPSRTARPHTLRTAGVVTALAAGFLVAGVPAVGVELPLSTTTQTILRAIPAGLDSDPPTPPVITAPTGEWVRGGPWGSTEVVWQAATDAGVGVAGYRVLLDGVVTKVLPSTATSTSVAVGAFGPHVIAVEAADAAGNTATSEVLVTAGDYPEPPDVTATIAGDGSVRVDWALTPSTPAVTEVQVSISARGEQSLETHQLDPGVTTTEFTGLENGRDYTIWLSAWNVLGCDYASNVSVVPEAPDHWIRFDDTREGLLQPPPALVSWEVGEGLAQTAHHMTLSIDGTILRHLNPDVTDVRLTLTPGEHHIEITAADPHTLTVASDDIWVDVGAGSPFPDVSTSHPFVGAITWLFDRGVTTGYSDGTFRPGAEIRRDAMAAFLFRLTYSDLEGYEPPEVPRFTDVPLSHPFYTEISWLAESGISTGYADGTFRPDQAVNRDAMAAFLFRLVAGPDGSSYPYWRDIRDVGPDHPFAGEIQWMYDAQISWGYPDDTYRPNLPVSREAMAAFLYRVAAKFRTDFELEWPLQPATPPQGAS